jgi:hypothetical protein
LRWSERIDTSLRGMMARREEVQEFSLVEMKEWCPQFLRIV